MKTIGIPLSGDDLLRMLRGGDEDGDGGPAARALPEADVATLREIAERYARPCPFNPGDIITPLPGQYNNAGEPHVVLEVAEFPIRNFDEGGHTSAFSNSFGARLDIRVALIDYRHGEGRVECYWQESWRHEPWKPKG